MPADRPDLKALLGAAVEDRHSLLYAALRDNHDLITRSFQKGRLDGAALVAGFAKLGIMDGDGKPPTLRGAQQTWYGVIDPPWFSWTPRGNLWRCYA